MTGFPPNPTAWRTSPDGALPSLQMGSWVGDANPHLRWCPGHAPPRPAMRTRSSCNRFCAVCDRRRSHTFTFHLLHSREERRRNVKYDARITLSEGYPALAEHQRTYMQMLTSAQARASGFTERPNGTRVGSRGHTGGQQLVKKLVILGIYAERINDPCRKVVSGI